MKTCDLHTHSVYSDGTWTPEQLIDGAERIGLGAIALCDHNTVAGLPDFMAAARGREVEAIPGIEFSTDYQGTELHILGLFIRPEFYDEITRLLAQAQQQKQQSNMDLVENLNRAGYALDFEKIQSATRNGQFNRAHVAAELTRLGYTDSVQDAFRRLLAPEHGYYHPPKRMTSFECIRYIRSIGAVSVLAHPFLNLDEARLRGFLSQAAECGLHAMETVYVSYDAQTVRLSQQLADEYGLKHSGGSDFHGGNKPDIQLGTGRGGLQVPMELALDLKEILKNGLAT